jgi:hypothetical protein
MYLVLTLFLNDYQNSKEVLMHFVMGAFHCTFGGSEIGNKTQDTLHKDITQNDSKHTNTSYQGQ